MLVASRESSIRAAARHSSLQRYTLYAKAAPIAFQLASIKHETFFAHDIGYDPACSKLRIGIFLHPEILTELAASGATKVFDFSVADNLHKQRLSTRRRAERHYYLIPKRLSGALLTAAMRSTNLLSEGLGRLLECFELKPKLKRIIRSWSAR